LGTVAISCSSSATIAPAGARSDRSPGDSYVLLAIDHEGHWRSSLGNAGGDLENLFARISAEGEQAGIHAREHQVSGGRKRTALIESGRAAGHAPAFLLRDGIPGN
jgi:hypothetical protein